MITVVTVFNDRDVFESMLGASVARQRTAVELVALDNRGGRYSSAAAALNAGARQAAGDILFFAHQDVRFASDAWLAEACRQLDTLSGWGVAGVAGARAPAPDELGGDRVIVSNIEDSVPPQRAGHVALTAPVAVDTVDECAFFVPARVFSQFRFDEHSCPGWHLYAVDFSLTVRTAGFHAYALALPLYHRSGGRTVRVAALSTYESAYFRALRRVLRKHRAQYVRVPTTCGTWSTRRSVLLQRFPPAQVRQVVTAWFHDLAQSRR
jgi:hypothetical protein